MSRAIEHLQTLPWQQNTWATLARQLANDRLPNGILLVGPAGVGKAVLAERLVAGLLCEQPAAAAEPCGACNGCTLRKAGHHPDLVLAEPEAGKAILGVDVVREFNRKMFLTSSRGHGRVGWIPAADSMNAAAANALLKTLEEPPQGATLILAAASLAALPATIRSRCQLVPVAIATPDTALTWLREHYPELDDAALGWYQARPMLASSAEAEQGARQSWKTGLQAIWVGRDDPLAGAAAIDEADADAWAAYSHHLLRELLREPGGGNGWPELGALNRQGRAALNRLADSVQAALHLKRSQANRRLLLEVQCMEWARAGRVIRSQGQQGAT